MPNVGDHYRFGRETGPSPVRNQDIGEYLRKALQGATWTGHTLDYQLTHLTPGSRRPRETGGMGPRPEEGTRGPGRRIGPPDPRTMFPTERAAFERKLLQQHLAQMAQPAAFDPGLGVRPANDYAERRQRWQTRDVDPREQWRAQTEQRNLPYFPSLGGRPRPIPPASPRFGDAPMWTL